MKTNGKKALFERLYQEYKLRDRVRLSLILSMIFYPSFLILDMIVVPERLQVFTIIRLTVVILNGLLLFSLRLTKSFRGLLNLGIALLVIDSLGISIMIFLMGGLMSFYYQGLTLIVMCMMVLLPFSFREAVISMSLVWATYLIPSLFIMSGESAALLAILKKFNLPESMQSWRISVNNLFFLTSIIVIAIFASSIMDSIRRREITSRIELETITEKLRESNIKLKSLDELKTQFFSNINHELRTPLTLMLAPLKSIIEGKMGRITAVLKDALETMQRNGYKLLKLINNLLDLTKLEEGKMRLRIKTINFNEFIASLLASVKPMSDQKKLRLYFQHPPQDWS